MDDPEVAGVTALADEKDGIFDLTRGGTRGMRAQIGARTGDDCGHSLEDVQATLASLGEGLRHHLVGQGTELIVELDCCDTVLGTCDFEVHVSGEVFHSLDV